MSQQKKGFLSSTVDGIRSVRISMDGIARIGFFFHFCFGVVTFDFTKVVSFSLFVLFFFYLGGKAVSHLYAPILAVLLYRQLRVTTCSWSSWQGKAGGLFASSSQHTHFCTMVGTIVLLFAMGVLFWIYENMIITRNGWMSLDLQIPL